jgi:hypothetical protein
MSVDHVVPRSDALRLGIPVDLFEDAVNLVLCCSGCNGFGNRYRSIELPQEVWTIDAFLALRDRIYSDRSQLISKRREIERAFFDSRPWVAVPTPGPATHLSAAPKLAIGQRSFVFQQRLEPARDAGGLIQEFRPQERFANTAGLPLHDYGEGPFCNFRITAAAGLAGVYAFVVDGEVRYLGECEDLRARFNAGYGNISPRNCFLGGQPTNCKINRFVLQEAQAGRRIDLYFCRTALAERKAVEHELLSQISPPWNGRLAHRLEQAASS